jgi:hypothetical protein
MVYSVLVSYNYYLALMEAFYNMHYVKIFDPFLLKICAKFSLLMLQKSYL